MPKELSYCIRKELEKYMLADVVTRVDQRMPIRIDQAYTRADLAYTRVDLAYLWTCRSFWS